MLVLHPLDALFGPFTAWGRRLLAVAPLVLLIESEQVIHMLSQGSRDYHVIRHVTGTGPNHLPLVYRWDHGPLAS